MSSGESGWESLPTDLLDLLLGEADMKDMMQMRLVCKAWRDGSYAYSGPAALFADAPGVLSDVHAILPSLCNLRVMWQHCQPNLQVLSSFANLSSLRLTDSSSQWEKEPTSIFGLLPEGLRELELVDVLFDQSDYNSPVGCVDLTRLRYYWDARFSTSAQVYDLLQQLPLLEELELASVEWGKIEEVESSSISLFRSDELTKLTLSYFTLELDTDQMPFRAFALQHLQLKNVYAEDSQLRNLASCFPNLVTLELETCVFYISDDEVDMDSEEVDRILNGERELEPRDSLGFLSLAPQTLESLSYQPEYLNSGGMYDLCLVKPSDKWIVRRSDMENISCDLANIATLSFLTELELTNVEQRAAGDLSALQNMGLLKLSLIECYGLTYGLAEVLIVPGSFSLLQKLHIEEGRGTNCDVNDVFHQFRESVFALPCLTDLSGDGRLFLLDIPKGWKLWSKCHSECCPTLSEPRTPWHSYDGFWYQHWRRVD